MGNCIRARELLGAILGSEIVSARLGAGRREIGARIGCNAPEMRVYECILGK